MKRRQALLATPTLLAAGWVLPGRVLAQTSAVAPASPIAQVALPAATPTTAPGHVVAWPEVSLLDGTRFGAAQLAGRAAVVVFWSTTCPFCKRHNQHVEKLFRAANPKTLAILGVAREKDAAVVQRYAAKEGYSFPITLDHTPLGAALSARKVIPLTVTLDRHGRLLQAIPGEMFEEDVMELLQLPGRADAVKRS